MALLKFLFMISLFTFTSCGMYLENLFNNTESVNERASSITDFTENFGESYKILLVSDVHFENNYQKNEKLFQTIDEMSEKPIACFVLGDLTRNCSLNEFLTYKIFCDDLKSAGINKVYAIPGNHDCDDGGKLFLTYVFPNKTYYRLKTNTLSYYFLDSSEGSHGDKQINNLQEIQKSDSNKKIVFSHYPLYVPDSMNDKLNKTVERALLISLFSKNSVLYYFCGHTHETYTYNFGNFNEVVIGDLKWSNNFAILFVDENSGNIYYKYE